jgi:hypothetical protein
MGKRLKRASVWALVVVVAFLCSLEKVDAQAAEEVAPATHLASEAIDLGDGWGQTLWRDAEGNAYDLGAVFRLPAPLAPAAPAASSQGGVPGMIVGAARRYGLDPDRMLRVAWCESEYDPNAEGDGGASWGVFQFQRALWSETPQGRAGLSRKDAAANIEAAMWAWSHGKRSHWSCQG